MFAAEGIPGVPDLTHPHELMQWGGELLALFWIVAIAVGGLGVILALFRMSRRQDPASNQIVTTWMHQFNSLLLAVLHGALVLALVTVGFFFCSTLANRYHHWEQAKVAQVVASVSGERLQQVAPQAHYRVQEPYSDWISENGRLIEVERQRLVPYSVPLAQSQIQVTITEVTAAEDGRSLYKADFTADYQLSNPLQRSETFFFQIIPPDGYSLLQNFRVERDNQRLQPIHAGDYTFPFQLEAGQSTTFRVAYQVQGGPRWVYQANGQLLSNFQLIIDAKVDRADFASGVVPTQISTEADAKRFTWIFADNVSVTHPFGVFTATSPVLHTGILPRLLLLTPALFLWWLGLLYLSLRLDLRSVVMIAGISFAAVLTLTYLSRFISAELAWAAISCVVLGLVWGLGSNQRMSLAVVICTISGFLLPVLGLLIPYSGLTLSLAAMVSVLWLVLRHWYGWSNAT